MEDIIETGDIREKIFDFKITSYNKDNLRKMNSWLWSTPIRLLDVTLEAKFNGLLFFRYEMSIRHVEFRYTLLDEEEKFDFRYIMSCISENDYRGMTRDMLKGSIKDMHRLHPEYNIVWDKRMEELTPSVFTQAYFYIRKVETERAI